MTSAPAKEAYRVSTITAVGNLGVALDLQVVAETLPLLPEGGHREANRSRYAKDVEDALREERRPQMLPVSLAYTGTPQKEGEDGDGCPRHVIRRGRTSSTSKKEKRMFDNQMTLLLQDDDASRGEVNMKVFGNGRVQITGAKTIDSARSAVDDVRRIVFATGVVSPKVDTTYASAVAKSSSSFRVCLINSDIRLSHTIRRPALYRAMVEEERMFCAYEPCTYPGVKVVFLCNANGECRRGDSPAADGTEVRLRCVIFRSGCVLLTGALTYAHLDGGYAFVMGLLRKHASRICGEATNAA